MKIKLSKEDVLFFPSFQTDWNLGLNQPGRHRIRALFLASQRLQKRTILLSFSFIQTTTYFNILILLAHWVSAFYHYFLFNRRCSVPGATFLYIPWRYRLCRPLFATHPKFRTLIRRGILRIMLTELLMDNIAAGSNIIKNLIKHFP